MWPARTGPEVGTRAAMFCGGSGSTGLGDGTRRERHVVVEQRGASCMSSGGSRRLATRRSRSQGLGQEDLVAEVVRDVVVAAVGVDTYS